MWCGSLGLRYAAVRAVGGCVYGLIRWQQLLEIWNTYRGNERDVLLWGDEVGFVFPGGLDGVCVLMRRAD